MRKMPCLKASPDDDNVLTVCCSTPGFNETGEVFEAETLVTLVEWNSCCWTCPPPEIESTKVGSSSFSSELKREDEGRGRPFCPEIPSSSLEAIILSGDQLRQQHK